MPIEYLDLPAHPRSLIRTSDGHFMGSQGSNVSTDEKIRLWSDFFTRRLISNFAVCTCNMYLLLDSGSIIYNKDISNTIEKATKTNNFLFLSVFYSKRKMLICGAWR